MPKIDHIAMNGARAELNRLARVVLVVSIIAAGLSLAAMPVYAGINDLTQLEYRWYENVDGVQPTVALAAEDTAANGVTQGGVYHLRMNLSNGSPPTLGTGSTFKFQHATSTSGPWTDVGAIGSGATWRGYDNATPADGTEVTSVLLTSSFTNAKQTYEEANNATTVNAIGNGKEGEFGWVVQDNAGVGGTAYYFRMVQSSGTALNAYTTDPQITPAVAAVTVTETATTTDVTEGGATDTYDVVLDAEPSGTVTITVSGDSQATTSAATLTFTTGNWNTAQTVTVTAIDDAVVENSPHTGTITHSASGGGYTGVSISNVAANITDDDASVTVTETGGSTDVTEGGPTDTYDVVLDKAPTGTVTVTVSSDAQATTSAATLTFTTGNWSSPQTVTVTAIDDASLEGMHTATITHSAAGGGYDSASIANVVANVTDDDASVTVTETGGSTDVTEGGPTDTYDVVLDNAPTGTVTITVSPDSQVSVSTTTLVFTTGNWDSPQTVTVTGVNDAVVEGGHTGTISHSASGGGYDGAMIDDVVASITDNDTGSVTITESASSTDVTEGGATDTYDVVLDLEPSATVTISMSSDAQATTSPATLTFTTGNWSTPQTVTASAVNDAVVEDPHTGTISHSASGGNYDAVSISNVVANVTYNDTPTVTITESGGPTDVTEGGATDTYDVVLDLEPSGTVTITISSDSEATTSPASLTFTTGN